MKTTRMAFTLIELLIVIAIISILTLIAVPNYTEAQIRAKVSRTRADLRTLATVLEVYAVDAGAYPTMIESGFDGGVKPWLEGSLLKWWYVPNALSTPIAYVTNAHILCPFEGDVDRQGDFPDEIWRRYSYENILELERKAQEFTVLQAKYGPEARASEKVGLWRVLSIGPDQSWNPMIHYHPTNGTLSPGNIIHSQTSPQGIES